jgi:hypothetical protein
VLAVKRVKKTQGCFVIVGSQIDAAFREGHRLFEDIAKLTQAALKNPQMNSQLVIEADIGVVEILVIVQAHQTGHLLKIDWPELYRGLEPTMKRLKSPANQALPM